MKNKSALIPKASNPNWQSQFGLLYIIFIFGFSLLAYHRSLLDYTLLPRYVCASCVFLIVSVSVILKSFKKNNKLHWPQINWPILLLLSYFLWSTLSVAWATNFSEAIFESQKGILGFAAFYMCRWFQLNDGNFVTHLLKMVVLLSSGILLLAGWQIIQLDTSLENAYYEVRGISGHKNLFSTVLFLLAGFLGIAYSKLETNWRKIAAILFVVSLLLIVYLRTRSVYLGFSCGFMIFLFFQLKQRLQAKTASLLSRAMLGIILLGLLGFLILWQTNQLTPLLQVSKIDQLWQSETGAERLVLWDKTACVIRQSPIWGIGAGNWQIEYPNCSVKGLYSVELDFTTFQRPHNDWLWVWAETGIIGLICYLGFFLTLLQASLHILKKQTLYSNRLALLTRLSFIVGYMIIACFSFPKERVEIILLSYTLFGLLYPIESTQNIKSAFFAKLVLLVIILGAVLNLFIGQKRMIGESAMKNVLLFKQQKKWKQVVTESDRAYSQWYSIDPTTIPIHWHRGTANFVLGKKEMAFQDFLKAEKYTPFNQHVQNDLGTCYELKGQKEKARTHYKESARISPSFDDPRVNLAVSYYNSGEYEEALGWLKNIRNKEIQSKYQKIITKKQEQLNN